MGLPTSYSMTAAPQPPVPSLFELLGMGMGGTGIEGSVLPHAGNFWGLRNQVPQGIFGSYGQGRSNSMDPYQAWMMQQQMMQQQQQRPQYQLSANQSVGNNPVSQGAFAPVYGYHSAASGPGLAELLGMK